ncbi:hypothetical protein UlMin_029134 [Ulmus minor]
MEMLPEDCVCTILSFTSPLETSKSTLVSTTFRSASESDVVWDRFLPPDYQDLLLRLVKPLKFSTKKELFFLLCNWVLIDGGRKSFKIDKSSGKKSYLLSARELFIAWSDEPMYWIWKHISQSRLGEVAELRTGSWIEIYGKIKTPMLSKNTIYVAYLKMRISNRAYGLNTTPFEVSVEVGKQVSHRTVCLCGHDKEKQQTVRMKILREIEDGWMEVELGEFFNGENDEEVKMSFTETKDYHLKAGLVIKGIELRPKL